jgi:hypothetical protein
MTNNHLGGRVVGRILTPAEWRDMKRRLRSQRRESGRGSVNVYVCDICYDLLIAVDRDAGVTPFLMPCPNALHKSEFFSRRRLVETAAARRDTLRMPDGSPISARSVCYRVPEFITPDKATVEFYRPAYRVYMQMTPGAVRDAISNGQLIFRSIDGNGFDLKNLED